MEERMKKLTFIALGLLLCTSMVFVAGCKGKSSSGSGGNEITVISNKIEIDEALKAYAAVYQKQSGVKVNIKSFGGETPYAPNLAAMFNSGTEPEIFVIEGKAGYEDAKRSGRISDLSGEPWVKDTGVAYIDPADGKVIGFPVAVEGWGLGYNKALLAKAGIDPKTLINVGAIKAAFEKIESQKSQLGIDAVVSMVAGPGMTWVTGLHGFNAYLALGLPYNDSTKYIDMLLKGQVDTPRLTKYAEYYNLLFKYSIKNTLLTGGYDQQLGDYAVGKTVFIHQGNWTDPTFKDLGITFEMGYVPHAFLDEDTDGIFVGAPSWYLVNPKSKNVADAKKFLIAMSSTPEGHDYMVNKAGMVPAFKSCKLSPEGQLSKAVQEWSNLGKIYAWQQNEMPDGFGMNTLGPIFHQMASGQIDPQGFVRLTTAAVSTIK
jgi:raffinose/stachyose/melibiose transport system substrate-binding protein